MDLILAFHNDKNTRELLRLPARMTEVVNKCKQIPEFSMLPFLR